jgi:hypothetical protein
MLSDELLDGRPASLREKLAARQTSAQGRGDGVALVHALRFD